MSIEAGLRPCGVEAVEGVMVTGSSISSVMSQVKLLYADLTCVFRVQTWSSRLDKDILGSCRIVNHEISTEPRRSWL